MRMFERDKDELRAFGVPIETVLDGPAGAHLAINFADEMANWDSLQPLMPPMACCQSRVERRAWYEFNAQRTGAVVAKLRTGDPAGARRFMVEMGRLGANPPFDMRMMLLDAYLLPAEREE